MKEETAVAIRHVHFEDLGTFEAVLRWPASPSVTWTLAWTILAHRIRSDLIFYPARRANQRIRSGDRSLPG